jgi:hypothetical protein
MLKLLYWAIYYFKMLITTQIYQVFGPIEKKWHEIQMKLGAG